MAQIKAVDKIADEMFEELGYIQNQHVHFLITYKSVRNGLNVISFDTDSKVITVNVAITLNIYKAIHKQVQELGWL